MVALTRDAQTYLVSAGDIVGTSYRVESVGQTDITVIYLPLNRRQTIAFSSISPEKARAPAAAAKAPPVSAPVPAPLPTTTLGTKAPTCC